jgi:hypothetical protein
LPLLEEPVGCRGINGSLSISGDKMKISGVGGAQSHDVPFSQVSSVVVERKSVVPFATSIILAFVVVMLVRYNAFWFVIDLSRIEVVVTWIGLGIIIVCAIPTVLRAFFVNVSVRSSAAPLKVRLVPTRSAKRLAGRFSEISVRN